MVAQLSDDVLLLVKGLRQHNIASVIQLLMLLSNCNIRHWVYFPEIHSGYVFRHHTSPHEAISSQLCTETYPRVSSIQGWCKSVFGGWVMAEWFARWPRCGWRKVSLRSRGHGFETTHHHIGICSASNARKNALMSPPYKVIIPILIILRQNMLYILATTLWDDTPEISATAKLDWFALTQHRGNGDRVQLIYLTLQPLGG